VEQRRLRLGDILDDYCPRERRVTNHAIVAMIEENVKQTRCTTCDAEHAYKGGKAPRPRKKDAPALADALDLSAVVGAVGAADSGDVVDGDAIAAPDEQIETEEPLEAEAVAAASANPDEEEPVAPSPFEDGPVHRPLIRAQLPRPEGQKIERQIPDFTVRHAATARRASGGFGGTGRPKNRTQGGGTGSGNGNRPHGRFSGPRPGASGRSGAPAGFRSGPPRHGGKKRSR